MPQSFGYAAARGIVKAEAAEEVFHEWSTREQCVRNRFEQNPVVGLRIIFWDPGHGQDAKLR